MYYASVCPYGNMQKLTKPMQIHMVAPYMYRHDIYRYMIYVISLTDISEPGTWMQDASVAYIAYICQPSCISVAGLRMGRSHSDCLCTGSAGESIPGNHISKRLCPFWSRETSQQIFCLKRKSKTVEMQCVAACALRFEIYRN